MNKPVKNGLKVYCVCDAATGYLLSFHIHTGEHHQRLHEARLFNTALALLNDNPQLRVDDESFRAARAVLSVDPVLPRVLVSGQLPSETNKLFNLIDFMVTPYADRGHIFCMDNWYSSPSAFVHLLDNRGTGALGTVRSRRRGLPKKFKPKKKALERGEYKIHQSGSLTAVAWRDNNIVTFISTVTDPTVETTVDRQSRSGATVTLAAPLHVEQYAKNYQGVDRFDQHMSYYYHPQRIKRWWLSPFNWLLHAAVVNSFLLYTQFPWSPAFSDRAKMSQRAFRRALIAELIGDFTCRTFQPVQRGVLSLLPSPCVFACSDHAYCVIPGVKRRKIDEAHKLIVQKDDNKRGKCKACGAKCRTYCSGCKGARGGKVWFCVTSTRNCFASEH